MTKSTILSLLNFKSLLFVSVAALGGNILYKNTLGNTTSQGQDGITNAPYDSRIEELTKELDAERLKTAEYKSQLSEQSEVKQLTLAIEKEEKLAKRLMGELNIQNTEINAFVKTAFSNNTVSKIDKSYVGSLKTISKAGSIKKKTSNRPDKFDYYNKVPAGKSKTKGLQENIKQLYSKTINKKIALKKSYANSLDSESAVRQDEMRTVVMKKGDTLWALAERAYGDGSLYPKIIAANPHISIATVRRLTSGTKIRVPTGSTKVIARTSKKTRIIKSRDTGGKLYINSNVRKALGI